MRLVRAWRREKKGLRDLVVGKSLVHDPILGIARAGHLLAFFCFVDHARHCRVFHGASRFNKPAVAVRLIGRAQFTERRVGVAVLDVPLVQVFHVGDAVQAAFFLQRVRVSSE